jgi:hypothetical protein
MFLSRKILSANEPQETQDFMVHTNSVRFLPSHSAVYFQEVELLTLLRCIGQR